MMMAMELMTMSQSPLALPAYPRGQFFILFIDGEDNDDVCI